jgi:hypothetical protein
MGTYTSKLSLYKPILGETGWDEEVNLNFDRLDIAGSGFINVKSHPYNATGNGVTDDTAAIQAAIDALPSTGGTAFFPSGLYICATGLSWNKDAVSLAGQGANGSIIKFTGTGEGITVGDGVAVRNGVGFRDLTIRGNQTQPATGIWLRICWQVNITNVNFTDFATYSLNAESGGHIRVIGCQGSNNVAYTGTYFRLSSVVVSTIMGCTFESNGGTCISIGGACAEVTVTGCNHRGTAIGTFAVVGGSNIAFMGCTAQNLTATGINASSGVDNLNISGNVFQGLAPSGSALLLSNCDRVAVNGNVFRDWDDAVVNVTSGTDFAIVGNYIDADNRPIYDGSGATGVVAHNVLIGNAPTVNGTGLRYHENKMTPSLDVASAATVTLPAWSDYVNITGTTPITSVTASYAGRKVTLKFAGILTFTDGSNLKLAGDFVTSADDTITLVCDGTNWFEVGRSAN